MTKLRSVLVLFAALALSLGACGDGEGPEAPGGTGGSVGAAGSGGHGGSGGAGGADGRPVVLGFEPDRAGPGYRIRVLGENLARSAPKNSLFFVTSEGATQPTLESKGLAADEEGTWFQVDVPTNAKSGPTLVTVETEEGRVTLESPDFIVTDDKLPPVITGVKPTVITQGPRDVLVTMTGSGFYPNVTTLTLDGEDHPIDWKSSNMTRVVFTLPSAKANALGSYVAQLITPAPGGGETAPQTIKVVPPINLLSVEAVGRRGLRATFDQPVGDYGRGSFSIVGESRAIHSAQGIWGSPTDLEIQLRRTLEEGETYTLRVNENFTSSEGGAIGEREAEFTAWVSED